MTSEQGEHLANALARFRERVKGDMAERNEAFDKWTNVNTEPCKTEVLSIDPLVRKDIRCSIEDLAPSRRFVKELHIHGATYLPIVIELEKNDNPLRVNFGLMFSAPSDIGLDELPLLKFYVPSTIEEMDALYTWSVVPVAFFNPTVFPEEIKTLVSRLKATFDPENKISYFFMSVSLGETYRVFNVDWSVKNDEKFVGEMDFTALVLSNPKKMVFSVKSSIHQLLCSRNDHKDWVWSGCQVSEQPKWYIEHEKKKPEPKDPNEPRKPRVYL